MANRWLYKWVFLRICMFHEFIMHRANAWWKITNLNNTCKIFNVSRSNCRLRLHSWAASRQREETGICRWSREAHMQKMKSGPDELFFFAHKLKWGRTTFFFFRHLLTLTLVFWVLRRSTKKKWKMDFFAKKFATLRRKFVQKSH